MILSAVLTLCCRGLHSETVPFFKQGSDAAVHEAFDRPYVEHGQDVEWEMSFPLALQEIQALLCFI